MFKCEERENSGIDSSERGGRRLKAAPESGPLGSPGSGPREGDGPSAVTGGQARAAGANAGGTAEGLPFVPALGTEGVFI